MAETATADPSVEPMFDTAHGALVFAFNYAGQRYDRPMMLRAWPRRPPAPARDLGGLDGAAQAGMIRAQACTPGPAGRVPDHRPRGAAHAIPCACRAARCAGTKPNMEWRNAVSFLADHVRYTALKGCVTNGILRRAYVVRYFTSQGRARQPGRP